MNLQSAIDEFLLAGVADGLSRSTMQWKKSQIGKFAKHFVGHDLEKITTHQIRQYLVGLRSQNQKYIDAPQRPAANEPLSEETVNTHIRCLHRFWRWCAEEYGIDNPMSKIRYPQPKADTPKAISPDDFIRLMEATGESAAGVRDRALLAFLADTGCRLGGLLSLTMSNLDMGRRRALVTEKGKISRMVFFTPFTAELMRRWLYFHPNKTESVFCSMNTDQPLTESGVYLILKRLKKKAGVKGRANPHAFRHNFARQYLKNGGDVATLARLLGHTNINTTVSYYAIFAGDELGETHDKYSPLRGMT